MPHFCAFTDRPPAFFRTVVDVLPSASRLCLEGGTADECEDLGQFVIEAEYPAPSGTLWPKQSRLVLTLNEESAACVDAILEHADHEELASHAHVYSQSGQPLVHWWDWLDGDVEFSKHVSVAQVKELQRSLGGEWRDTRSPAQTLRGEVTNRTWAVLGAATLIVVTLPGVLAMVGGAEVDWWELSFFLVGVGFMVDIVRRWKEV